VFLCGKVERSCHVQSALRLRHPLRSLSASFHHSVFYVLVGGALLFAAFGVISLRRHPVTHFLQEMRRLAD
jgi:hypothetical protein